MACSKALTIGIGVLIGILAIACATNLMSDEEGDGVNTNTVTFLVGQKYTGYGFGFAEGPHVSSDLTWTGSIPGLTIVKAAFQPTQSYVPAVTGTPTTPGTYTLNFYDSGTLYRTTTVKVVTSATYTVHYDANGGSYAPADTVENGTGNASNAPGSRNIYLTDEKPVREGYTFNGWKTTATGTGMIVSGYVTVHPGTTTTVYADWTKNTSLSINAVEKQYGVAGGSVSFTGSCKELSSGVTYSASNVPSGLNVSVNGSNIICSSTTAGTYSFILKASASGFTSSTTTVTVEFVPMLAFSNTPSAGALNA